MGEAAVTELKVQSRNLLEWTKEIHENPQSGWPASWPRYELESSRVRSRLGGVVVSVIATGPKVDVFETDQGDGFLRAIKNSNTPSSRMGNKAGGPMS
jgi:hypothetical protein